MSLSFSTGKPPNGICHPVISENSEPLLTEKPLSSPVYPYNLTHLCFYVVVNGGQEEGTEKAFLAPGEVNWSLTFLCAFPLSSSLDACVLQVPPMLS